MFARLGDDVVKCGGMGTVIQMVRASIDLTGHPAAPAQPCKIKSD